MRTMRCAAAARRIGVGLVLGLVALAAACDDRGSPVIERPAIGLLAAPGDVAVSVRLPAGAEPGTARLLLDGAPVAPGTLVEAAGRLAGTLPGVPVGEHRLVAEVVVAGRVRDAAAEFVLVDLERPDECEVLNQAACALPFPSSRFLEPADTPTGVRVAFGQALPVVNRASPPFGVGPIDPAPFRRNDGFSPTAQILAHFPLGVDLVASAAPRLDPVTRIFGTRALERGSPSLLLDWESGERVNHFLENDARAADPARRITFLRPGESLRPGHRYIVAFRRLVDPNGDPVRPEPAFAAIRNGQPSELPAVEEARARLEPVLARLEELGVRRDELVLAFDFVVQSDASLTAEMLAMRDQGFAWLAARRAAGAPTFTVDSVSEVNPGCADPAQPVWRDVRGTFDVPLFLDRDPFAANREVGFLVHGGDGAPQAVGTTAAPFGIVIPCAVFDAPGGFAPLPALLVGHGLFGTGPSTVSGLAQSQGLEGLRYVTGGTNWSGLSGLEVEGCNFDIGNLALDCFIFKVLANLDLIPALADRLRQGQLDTLLLARLLRDGDFNAHPAFQDAQGRGVLSADGEVHYFGASLGGIMGLMFAALTPDVERLNVDVPAINFSLLLQRATPFLPFQLLLDLLVNPDPMDQIIALQVVHEVWVKGEPAGYATHVTDDPLPGVPFEKRILLTVALWDQNVANLGSIVAGATLGLPNLEGSVLADVPGIPDASGPQDSAFVVYDTASFDLSNPAHLPFVPPAANLPPQPNRCDPHVRRGFIPASVDQLLTFLQPLGRVVNFCGDDGLCNASEPYETPFADTAPCDPLG